jgi:transposase
VRSTPSRTPLGFILTGGEVSEYRAVPQLLDLPAKPPKALLADKGYDSDAVRERLLLHNILPVIPPKTNRRDPTPCDYRRYRARNQVERMFNRLKQFRRIIPRLPVPCRRPCLATLLCQQGLGLQRV